MSRFISGGMTYAGFPGWKRRSESMWRERDALRSQHLVPIDRKGNGKWRSLSLNLVVEMKGIARYGARERDPLQTLP